MTAAQQDALRRAAAEARVKIATPTARILNERYGYIEPDGDGWRLSHRGRAHLAGERAREAHREVERGLSREARKWADRVGAWLDAHRRFRQSEYAMRRYACHVAACDFDGVEPMPEGPWTAEARTYVEQTARAAADVLRDFDETAQLAVDRGVGVTVAYEADPKKPGSRRDAAKAAVTGADVVRLSTYRERRPTGGAA